MKSHKMVSACSRLYLKILHSRVESKQFDDKEDRHHWNGEDQRDLKERTILVRTLLVRTLLVRTLLVRTLLST